MVTSTQPGDFSAQASAYAEGRPGYPPALVERLLARARVAPGDAVVDLGAGTGMLTRQLSGRGLRLTAIDPSEAMLDAGAALRLADATWHVGTFERTGLPDDAFHWAVAAQAFH